MQPKYYGAAANYNGNPNDAMGKIIKIALLVFGVIIVLTIGFLVISAINSGPRDNAARLVARERQLLTFLNANQENIQNEDLRTLSTNAATLLTSDLYTLEQGLRTSYGLAPRDIPQNISAAETDTQSAATLNTARQQSRYDQTFAQILRDKLAASQSLAQSVASSSRGAFKQAVQTHITHLQDIINKLAALNT